MEIEKKVKRLKTIIIALSAVIVMGLALGIFLVVRFNIPFAIRHSGTKFYAPSDIELIQKRAHEEGRNDFKNELRTRLNNGDTINYLLRTYFPDYFVYSEGSVYRFKEIDDSLAKNELKSENFKTSDSEISYSDGDKKAHKAIDVSTYQGSINFSKVKSDGVDYTFIRCGYRGYSEGKIQDDASFDENAAAALRNGLKIGTYFFTQATTKAEAEEEAEYVLKRIAPYNVTLPVAIDVEKITTGTARQAKLTDSELTDIVVAFCEKIKAAGYTPMVYANMNYFAGHLDLSRLESYHKWYAFYSDSLYMPYKIAMWQYSSEGKVSGIDGNTDINLMFEDFEK